MKCDKNRQSCITADDVINKLGAGMSITTLMLQPWTEICKVVLVKVTVLLKQHHFQLHVVSPEASKIKINKSGDLQLQRYVEGVDSKQ